jgi:hypothetical protein
MARQVRWDRTAVSLVLTAATVSGCGAAVDAQLDQWRVREVSRSYERDVVIPESTEKENPRDRVRQQRGRNGASQTPSIPGLSFRWGMSYLDSNESVSSALSLAMHSLLLQRMAVEFGVMASLPTASARRTDSAMIGGTLSWLWFMGNSQVFRPYVVMGNGVSAGRSGGQEGFGAVLINFIGGLGFDVWLTQSIGFGLDCRLFAALSAESPNDTQRGVICTAAFAFSPSQ